ncbi:MAG TPA: hypothetical protein VI756_27405 [Blastocatellia bacterium]
MTAVADIDAKKYGQLLARTLPIAIRTEAENERMLAEIWKLMSKDEEALSPEEGALLVLMSELVEKFEEEHYAIEPPPPHEILKMLMEDRGLKQRDLIPVFGSIGVTSEVVGGKRAISKAQALLLGRFFELSPDLFVFGRARPDDRIGFPDFLAGARTPVDLYTAAMKGAKLSGAGFPVESLVFSSAGTQYLITLAVPATSTCRVLQPARSSYETSLWLDVKMAADQGAAASRGENQKKRQRGMKRKARNRHRRPIEVDTDATLALAA